MNVDMTVKGDVEESSLVNWKPYQIKFLYFELIKLLSINVKYFQHFFFEINFNTIQLSNGNCKKKTIEEMVGLLKSLSI